MTLSSFPTGIPKAMGDSHPLTGCPSEFSLQEKCLLNELMRWENAVVAWERECLKQAHPPLWGRVCNQSHWVRAWPVCVWVHVGARGGGGEWGGYTPPATGHPQSLRFPRQGLSLRRSPSQLLGWGLSVSLGLFSWEGHPSSLGDLYQQLSR